MGSTSATRHAAYVASWEQCLAEVGVAARCNSAQHLFDSAPSTTSNLQEAEAGLRRQGALTGMGIRWEQRFSTAMPKKQKEWAKEVHKVAHESLLAALAEEDRSELRSAGGVGAGAFLLPPTTTEHLMPDTYFFIAFRNRLRVDHLAAVHGKRCEHRSKQTTDCVEIHLIAAAGTHASAKLVVESGGGTTISVIGSRSGSPKPRVELHSPSSSCRSGTAEIVKENWCGRRVYLDVAVTDPGT